MPAMPAAQLRKIIDDILPPADAQLLSAFVERGDREAFASIVERHGPMVLSVAARCGNQASDRDDVFQAVFWLLARDARKIKQRDHLAAWLHRVACRCSRNVKHPKQGSDPDLLPSRRREPALAAAWKEVSAALDEEIARLPEDLRAPLVVCFLEGETQQTAARLLGLSFGTFRRRLDQARKILRARLAKRGIGESALLAAPGSIALPSTLIAQVIPYASGSALAASAALLVPAGALTMKTVSLSLACTLALGIFAWGGSTAQQPKEEAKKVEARESVAVDDFGDPLPEGAVRRIGTERMRGYQSVSFMDNGGLMGLKGNNFEEIDPATGKVLSREPLSFDGKTFEGRQGLDGGTSSAKLSEGGKYWIRCERRNPIIGGKEGDHEIAVYDRASGTRKLHIEKIVSDYAAFSFTSPGDGYFFVRGRLPMDDASDPPRFQVYDLSNGRHIGALAMDADKGGLFLGNLLVSPTEKELLRRKETLIRYSLPGLQEIGRFDIGDAQPASISADGKRLAVLAGKWIPKTMKVDDSRRFNRVVIHDIATGKEIGNLDGLCPERVEMAAFDPYRHRILVAGYNETLRRPELNFIDVKERKIVLQRTSSFVFSVQFSRDGRRLLLRCHHDLKCIDAENGNEFMPDAVVNAPSGAVAGLACAPDGSIALYADGSGILRFDPAGRLLGPGIEKYQRFRYLDVTSDGGTILGASQFNFRLLWIDMKSGRISRSFELPGATGRTGERQLVNAMFSGDGKRALYAKYSNDGNPSEVCEVRLAADGTPNHSVLVSDRNFILPWTFSFERNWLIKPPTRGLFKGQGSLELMDVGATQKVTALPTEHVFSAIQADHAGGRLACLRVDFSNPNSPHLDLLSLPDGKQVHSFPIRGQFVRFAFTRDDRFLVVCEPDGFHVIELSTGQPILRRQVKVVVADFRGSAFASSLSVAWDGKSFATGHAEGTVLIWDLLRIDGNKPVKPREEEVNGLLQSLSSRDAKQAHAAGCRLMLLGDAVIPKLLESLKPDPQLAENLAGLLIQLDDAKFAKREEAHSEILRLPEAADVALRKALADAKQADFKDRLTKILEARNKGISADALRLDRAKLLLERIGTPAAREALKAMR